MSNLASPVIPVTKRTIIPFCYPGGKYYALSLLKRFWLSCPHDEYREPFVGGGSVFFAKPKSNYNWINDLEPELVNTYQVMADDGLRVKLIERFSGEVATRERWAEIQAYQPENKLDRAFKYYYMNRMSFNGRMRSPTWGFHDSGNNHLPPNRWFEKLDPCGRKLEDVRITCLDFEAVVSSPSRGNHVLLYLDPPYYLPSKHTHYIVGFEESDHLRLAASLRKTQHSFFLSYEDNPVIRKLYDWAEIYPIEFFYRASTTPKKRMGKEIVISNFKISTS